MRIYIPNLEEHTLKSVIYFDLCAAIYNLKLHVYSD